MSAPETRYEIRTGGEIGEYVVTNDAAQQIFVSDAVVHQEAAQPEPEPDAGQQQQQQQQQQQHNMPPVIPGNHMVVHTTVIGGQDMLVYFDGKAYNIKVPVGHPLGMPLQIALPAEGQQTAPVHPPAKALPKHEGWFEKKVRFVSRVLTNHHLVQPPSAFSQ